MISVVSLLVAAALVSQHSGFEANAQIDNAKLTLDNHLKPNVIAPRRQRRMKKFVDVYRAPPPEVRRLAGERVELECVIMGNPPPAVVWERNGERIVNQFEDEINEIIPEVKWGLAQLVAKLVITSRTPGEDQYTCVASSNGKTDSATSVVYTMPAEDDETELVELQKTLLMPPSITYHFSELFQPLGTATVIPCRAQAASKPVIFWQDRLGRLIYNTSRMKVMPYGDLVISELQFDTDMGNLTCVAKNMFGKDIATTFVYPIKA